jgi:hypothetical protein
VRAGLLRHRLYTFRWLSLLVWLYVTEGLVRAPATAGCRLAGVGRGGAGRRAVRGLRALHPAARAAATQDVNDRKEHDMSFDRSAALAALQAAVGPEHVLADGDLSAWEQDWRRRWRGRALAVVRPGSTAEVAAVVRACATQGLSIVPQGGNTGLVGGGVPDEAGRRCC